MTVNSNLAIWDKVEQTDPKHTKQFTKGGGFKGTATNATYLAKKATSVFGPIGIGWGLNVIDEEMLEGEGGAKVHKVRVKFWYLHEGTRGEFEQFGQTQFAGKNKNGPYVDEEAPKKSLTDAMSKCLSLLGFAADIHMGLYDDNKYVSDMKREFRENPEFDESGGSSASNDNKAPAGKSDGDNSSSNVSVDDVFSNLKNDLANAKSIKEVTDIMSHKDTVHELTKILSKEDEVVIRKFAEERLIALGWKKGADTRQASGE